MTKIRGKIKNKNKKWEKKKKKEFLFLRCIGGRNRKINKKCLSFHLSRCVGGILEVCIHFIKACI